MTTRWILLSLLAFIAAPLTVARAQQSADRSSVKAEESRTPGRFFRKLREDFSTRKEEEDKPKSETPRTAQRGETPNRENTERANGGFASLFTPPAFLGGQAANRSDQKQESSGVTQPQSRSPFKFSQPTVPPPEAEELPRPIPSAKKVAPRQLPVPPRSPETKSYSSRQSAQQPKSEQPAEIGQPEAAPKGRQLDFASTPTRKQPKPSIKDGFGFDLVDRDDGVIIDKVKAKGNADQAELKKGDRIAKIGGVDVESIQQFQEIAEMLENGDQIEIVISRRGKEEDVTLQFGQPPAEPETSAESSQPALPEFRLSEPGEIPDFAPPANQSSRYEPGVTELAEENASSRGIQTSSGFRSPSLPAESDITSGYAEAEYQRIIRQQQDQIRQLQAQLQQLRQQQLRTPQQTPTPQRGRR